jgi:cytoskeletal protein RodZ
MILLDSTTDYVQAWSAIFLVMIGVATAVLSFITYFQNRRIHDLENIVTELKNQSKLMQEDVSTNKNRLSLEELEKQNQTGPRFDLGNSEPLGRGVIKIVLTNNGRPSNKMKAVPAKDSKASNVKVVSTYAPHGAEITILAQTSRTDSSNVKFMFHLQYSGQGLQWFQQDIINESTGVVRVTDRFNIDRPAD